jgi:tRNA A-37 threonylcarbamoyl transferase component Bud32
MDRIGRVVGSYEIVERIGEGGMGTVYRALDTMLEREVAVKAIRPELARDPHVAERFRAEAKLLARINHPAIATIYSFLRDGDELFLAMEFVRGRTLARALGERGAFPWPEAVALLSAALAGIEQVHRLGIVHRDLKPDNLMLTEAGAIKVMDFGIARAAGSERLTRTGLMVGTLRYMAPEQLRGEAGDRRSDIYSLGAVLYEMLTGRAPFASGSEYEVIRAQVEEAPKPPSTLVAGLPAWLDEAVLRALAKEPSRRFQSAEELRAFLAGGGVSPAAGLAAGGHETSPRRAEMASLPTAVKATPTPPPPGPGGPASAGSYRPVELTRTRRRTWVALATGLLLAVALALWGLHARAARSAAPRTTPPATAASSPAVQAPRPAPVAAAPPPQPAALPARSPSAAAAPAPAKVVETAARPRSAAPSRRSRRTAAAVAAPAPEHPAAPAPAGDRALAASATSASQEPAAPVPPAVRQGSSAPAPSGPSPAQTAVSPELMERLGELRATSRDLDAAAGRLSEAYRRYLEPRRAAGGRLTPPEERLQVAIEDIAGAASRFRSRLLPGAPPPPRAGGDRRAEILAHAHRLAQGGQQMERLIRAVQPGPEVESAWREVERLSRQAVEILSR